jgi:hypothetical protein
MEQINQLVLIPEDFGSWPVHAARNLIRHLLIRGRFD